MVCTRSSGCAEMPETDREKKIRGYRADFSMLGFNFDLLQVPELKAEARTLDIDITSFAGKKPIKHDYIYFLERHFALQRIEADKAPDHYLFPNFNASKQLNATIRQILVQHGHRYLENGTPLSAAKSADLAKFFADHIDEMRADRGVNLADAPTPVMESFFKEVGNMSINRASGTAGKDSLQLESKHGFPSGQSCQQKSAHGESVASRSALLKPSGRPDRMVYQKPVISTETAQKAAQASDTAHQVRTHQPRFGQTWQPAKHTLPNAAQKTGSNSTTFMPTISTPTGSTGEGKKLVPTTSRTLNQRKQAKLAAKTHDQMGEAVANLQSNLIAKTVQALYALRELFEDELDIEPVVERPDVTSSRKLNARRTTQLIKRVEGAADEILAALEKRDIAACITAVDSVYEDLEEEL